MPKWGAVGLGSDAADVDPDTVGNIYDEAEQGIPPKGPYLFTVKRFEAGETGENSKEPGTPKVTVLCEIAEPVGTTKSRYNGYGAWKHLPVTPEGAGRINQLLLALLDNSKLTAAKKKDVLKAFHSKPPNVVVEKPDGRGQQAINKIGTWTIPEGMLVGGVLLVEKDDADQRYISSFMPKSDAPKSKKAEPVDDEPDEDEDSGGDEEAREEELGEMDLAGLKAVAKNLKLKVPRGADEEALINLIMDEEFPPDDEPEPEDDDEDDDDPEEEDEDEEEELPQIALDGLSRADLKKVIADEELEIKVTKGMTDDVIRDAIREALLGDEDEEEPDEDEDEDEEPEPAKPVRKGRAGATPAAKDRPSAKRRAGSGKDDPPF